VTGIVQGVGFRPFVRRLADRHGLAGWVRNDSGSVEILVDGDAGEIDAFVAELTTDAPPLARVDDVVRQPSDPQEPETGAFRILESLTVEGLRQSVPADVALCAECERELFDPDNRRFRYPFITCTNCGPRYTVIESLPYDRERTTMGRFTQCAACRYEYDSPGDRRYHSETNSCPTCGPHLWARLARGSPALPRADHGFVKSPILLAAAYLRQGRIVAIRGIGGFHIAVDATDERAVCRLRARKQRDAKPFAVMVRTLADARAIAHVGSREASLLLDRTRPVVLLTRRADASIAPSVAPGLDTIGVMLAYTPVHHLLLDRVKGPLVMTSGNRSEEPIAATIPDAIARLDCIADLFLLHDREIVSPMDDSVVRPSEEHPIIIRRARGFAPIAIPLPHSTPKQILAVGGHLKSTFTLAADDDAFVSPHLGDLDGFETLTHYRATLARYSALFRVQPEVVARDLHPGYLSTRVAHESGLSREIVVQHHHAHIAAVLGEHRHDGPVIGVAFDGTGYGDDGTVWGAEFLIATQADYTRVGHLRPAPLPGGELAVREPWRSALGFASLEPTVTAAFEKAFAGIDDRERQAAIRQLERRLNSPMASSMGRLFDAAAAVLGVCRHARYEGEAAMRLETLAGCVDAAPLPFPQVHSASGLPQLDALPLLVALGEAAQRGTPTDELAAAFHESIARATAEFVADLSKRSHIRVVALGGGSFQNVRLARSLRSRLEAAGLVVLEPVLLPPNDGGLSYGQAVVAAAVLRCDDRLPTM
jgi:hydrogenase maturation protein HypF